MIERYSNACHKTKQSYHIRQTIRQINANNIMNQSNVRARHPIGVAQAREKRPTAKRSF